VEEKEAWRKAEEEETQRKEKECQRDLAHHIEANCVATIEQQCCKNWSKTFLLLSSPSNEDMNLIDLPPLTIRGNISDICLKKVQRLINGVRSWQRRWKYQLWVEEVCARGAQTSESYAYFKICCKSSI